MERVDDWDKSASFDVGAFPRRSAVSLDGGSALHPVEPMHDLPYELHTGRELEFMLQRGKPLAHFYDDYPTEPCEEIIPEAAFAPYVAEGLFEKREFVEPLVPPSVGHPQIKGIRHVLYARRCEGWRIDAYIMMRAAATKSGWSEGFERLQGALLGYEEWQTDVHLNRLRIGPDAKNFPWLRKP
jgi:hypothetical protein